ncbi:MAG: ATPase, partial [Caulobacteraceae bacterium]
MAAFGGPAPARVQAFPAPLRVLILSALLLLAVYTAFSAYRLKQSATGDRPAGPNLSADASLLVARADAASTRISAALNLAAERLQRAPDQPLDAAEAALRFGRPSVRAIATVGEAGILAIAGGQGLTHPQWQEAAAAAARSGRAYWIGRPEAASPLAYAVIAAPGSRGHTYLVAAIDPADLFPATSSNEVLALVGADGGVVHISGAQPGDGRMQTALGLTPGATQAAARTGDEIKGALADGQALKGRAMATPDGALIAIAAAPTASLTGAARRDLADSAFAVLAPLAIGLVLSLMLMRQSRRIEEAQAAQAETERKFRLAVEGARCGIWEWRLDDDTVFMSDVTGVMLGWGGAGVAKAEEVIGRIAPEHRDRVRDALASARHYGAFDVSFRIPGAHGSSWIDARGQAVEDAGPTGHAAILGVALDVTEERMTEARAQAAEGRLRDAIDAVSDAFVLWDKRGRLLICNNSYRNFFSLDQRVLKP